ncbi:MAG: Oligopeptide transport ATP-binding protein OppF [Syntrophomonadaceae bacterium]|nr:Oligopeptide transport ATP-binding protein OppF [Bacillota bacterium]
MQAVDDVSLSIYPGEVYALVGESGCGKSTTGHLMMLTPTAGAVIFEEKEIFALKKQEEKLLRKQVQLIFQDPYSSLNPRMTVGESIGETLEVHGIAKGEERRDKVKAVF